MMLNHVVLRLRRCVPRLLACALAMGVAGCETTQSISPTEVNRSGMAPWTDVVPAYRINPGDKLRVFYERTPELNEVALVAPDGSIGLRAAGQVTAAGLTIAELELAVAAPDVRQVPSIREQDPQDVGNLHDPKPAGPY